MKHLMTDSKLRKRRDKNQRGHVRFDVAGAGDGFMAMLVRHCQTKGAETDRHFLRIPRQSSTLPTYKVIKSMFVTSEGGVLNSPLFL